MATKVKAIPDQYHGVMPYLCVKGAAKALEFYAQAFGAEETMRFTAPDGQLGHAEMRIGDAVVMLADEYPEMGIKSPHTIGGTPVSLMFYVEDVDAFVRRAVDAGAKLTEKVEDKFYGDRAGKLTDPFGHVWMIATHKEDVSPEEMHKRAKALFGAS